ncbi:hypothetical protein BCM14_2699 [Jezberella montanilacus]|jgi:preprotein translocase subunit Sec63|uniref:Uncharacterized protein n=1 Tax=Jezberella montanilacus TaxID=323426 RepID=A0A2T0XBZ7_9BURK|nr:hypothetical protein [Jezberella montanilacus]PRY96460.1 hypothetical protein BCM14_2699 [Jezberella montanilacus]
MKKTKAIKTFTVTRDSVNACVVFTWNGKQETLADALHTMQHVFAFPDSVLNQVKQLKAVTLAPNKMQVKKFPLHS